MERKEILTVEEVAELLSIHPQTVRTRIRNGEIPAYRLGRRIYIKRADLMAALEPIRSKEDIGEGGDE